jgi:hypothetical protein
MNHDGPIPVAEILDYLPDDEPQAPQEAPDAPILALLDARRVQYDKPPPEPVTIYAVNSQSISTSGNLTCLSGQSKAGKSAALIGMVAAPFAKDTGRDFLGFMAAPTNGKAVLVYDTEQSPFDAYTLQCRALKRAGWTQQPPNLQHHYLLDLSISERREAVFAGARRAAGIAPGVYAAFIDGVADLLEDVNDAAEANALVSDLVKLSVEIDAPVIVVLHENPAAPGGGGKTRGHLGSQLERKAESNLRVIKDSEGISTLFGEKCRRASIPQHSGPRFAWDDEAGMHLSVEPAGIAKAEMAKEKDQADIEEIFDCPDALGGLPHKALMDRIQEVLNLKLGGARKRFDKMKASGLIRKNSENLWIR